MTKNAQRLSQVVSTFGPGSMVDLPTRSVVIGGLEEWEMRNNAFAVISEPRLAARLERLLKGQGRLEDSAKLSLRTPPLSPDTANGSSSGIVGPIFPKWFVCEQIEMHDAAGKTVRRRRLIRWQDLDAKGRRFFQLDDGKKSDVTPIRFVAACDDGHLQDIDWRWVVHGDTSCLEPMWLEEKGTSADPADTTIVCGCKKTLSLQDAFQPGRLGPCRGERPWLLDRDPTGCGKKLKLLTRTATNTYFPQVYTVISLPVEEDELTRLVEELSGELVNVLSVDDLASARKFNSKINATLTGHLDLDIYDRLLRIRAGASADVNRSPKLAEFDIFASGRAEIGNKHPAAKLYAETLPAEAWSDGHAAGFLQIQSLVAVHRLREVSCLYGFTRFEAAPTSADGDIEDIHLAVKSAPIARSADWLPAVEQFGEGLFIHFRSNAINSWIAREAVVKRTDQLRSGYGHWVSKFSGNAPDFPGIAYILLHSLSHALISEIALDCGYPASSLKERVYALSDPLPGAKIDRCGILIYTSSAGAQGTLGGLVAAAPRFAGLFNRALEKLLICSNDPVCADHSPNGQSGDRSTHGAACHGCLLVAETSCEMRNLFLDRALIVETMVGEQAGFFGV